VPASLPLPTSNASRGRPKQIGHFVGLRTPKSFNIQIQKTDLYVLPVPVGLKKHFKGFRGRLVKLLTTNTCACHWNVRLKFWNENFILGDGWRLVVLANNIRVGDILVFSVQDQLEMQLMMHATIVEME
jgi:hypothetical protein